MATPKKLADLDLLKAEQLKTALGFQGKRGASLAGHLNIDELKEMTAPEIVEAIKRVREGRLHIEPGYDGIYGKVQIYKDDEERGAVQKSLI